MCYVELLTSSIDSFRRTTPTLIVGIRKYIGIIGYGLMCLDDVTISSRFGRNRNTHLTDGMSCCDDKREAMLQRDVLVPGSTKCLNRHKENIGNKTHQRVPPETYAMNLQIFETFG